MKFIAQLQLKRGLSIHNLKYKDARTMKQQNQSLRFTRFSAAIAIKLTTTFAVLTLGGSLGLGSAAAREPLANSKFTPREFDFQASPPVQAPQRLQKVTPSSKSQSYLVYINENNAPRLQQVRLIEPTAFVRQYQGRSVIQAGVFSQNFNAQNLAIQLVSQGIDVRIVNLATGEDKDLKRNHKFYFVVIPAKREKLAVVENQVKQLKMGMPINISQKEQPRSHVRLGPFLERKQAENWKRYLKASGLRKVKVEGNRD